MAGPLKALATELLDLGDGFDVGAVRASGGRRTAVLEGKFATRPMPRQPPKRRSLREARGESGVLHRRGFVHDPTDEQGSTLRREARILVKVHPTLPGVRLAVWQPQPPPFASGEQPSWLLHLGIDVRAPQLRRQQMPATEHIQRQVAVAVVIAVEEPALLMAIQRVVGV